MIKNGYTKDTSSTRCFQFSCEDAILHIKVKHDTGVTTVDCPFADESATRLERFPDSVDMSHVPNTVIERCVA